MRLSMEPMLRFSRSVVTDVYGSTRVGSLILTGSTTPMHQQPIAFREKVFRGWDCSRFGPLRAVYRGLTAIVKKSWVMASPTMNEVLGFPRSPVHGKPADGFPFEFLQFPASDEPATVETDVVVVGSGCGGGVTANNLAEAGLRVLVVEKSYSYSSKVFPMTPNEAYVNMFENGGTLISDDGSTAVLAGSTWGGGGTINWSAALQTEAYVRQEWADTGLPFFTSLEFQRSLDRVCDRMGVNTEHIEHNRGNNVILEGARKMGYAAKAVPQKHGKWRALLRVLHTWMRVDWQERAYRNLSGGRCQGRGGLYRGVPGR
jgi:Choline dehydrogenase and related flavoproteins